MRFRHLSHLPSSGSTNRMVKTDKVCRSEKVSWCQSESSSEYALIVSSSRSERCLVSVFYHLLLDGSTTPDLTNTCLPKKKQRHFFIRQKTIDSAQSQPCQCPILRELSKVDRGHDQNDFCKWPLESWRSPKSEVGTHGGGLFFFGGRKKSVIFFGGE